MLRKHGKLRGDISVVLTQEARKLPNRTGVGSKSEEIKTNISHFTHLGIYLPNIYLPTGFQFC
ncbi:MAG: hypothetical protein AB4080_15940 [Trichodesmium sp.]